MELEEDSVMEPKGDCEMLSDMEFEPGSEHCQDLNILDDAALVEPFVRLLASPSNTFVVRNLFDNFFGEDMPAVLPARQYLLTFQPEC